MARGTYQSLIWPVDNIYLPCYTAICLSSIAGAGYSSPFPSHQRVHTRWFGRALEWHSRGKGFDPPHLHHKAPIERLVLFSCFLPFFAAQTSPRPRNSGFIFIEKQTGVPPSPAIWQRAAEAPVLLCLGKVQACRVFTGWSRRSWVKPWPRTSLIWVTVMKASGSTEWISSLAA